MKLIKWIFLYYDASYVTSVMLMYCNSSVYERAKYFISMLF